MREFTPSEKNRIAALINVTTNVAYLEPTQTGLAKSIMDATAPVRKFLKEAGFHDYQYQKQGPSNKVIIPAYFVSPDSLIRCEASLYRPLTKKGDPRIWFSHLSNYAQPGDILVLLAYDKSIYIINLTSVPIDKLIAEMSSSPILDLVQGFQTGMSSIAEELLYKLRRLAIRGWIPSPLYADTLVGRILERELDIPMNSSKKPDYKGIEVKSFRADRGNQKNLFAKVPNWELSKFKSSAEILQNLGYFRNGVFKLYCEVSAVNQNSQGLRFKISDDPYWLVEFSNKPLIGDFAVWEMNQLYTSLLEKHRETFWVAAKSKKINGIEHFLYYQVEHTRKPIIAQLDPLIRSGTVTMHHLIKKSIKGRVKEKGPLFKIEPDGIRLLFPPSKVYDLIGSHDT